MCGIFGIVFPENNPDLGKLLIEAGRRLTYRGYDSVGVATINSGSDKIDLRKDKGTVDKVSEKYDVSEMTGIRGITQLRWATFGDPAQVNAQPHIDCSENLVGAHNGNIVNTINLRKYFIKNGHDVKGMNDGEMVVHSIEEQLDGNYSRDNIRSAIIKSDEQLKGDYAFTFTHNKENVMYAAKKGSSLYVGVGENFICASSDLPSILPLTKEIVHLEDNEFVEYTDKKYRIFSMVNGKEIQREAKTSEIDVKSVDKGIYDHFMLKEIHEQPETVKKMLSLLEETIFVDKFLDVLHKADHIYFVASGSSFNAAVSGAYFFNKLSHKVVIPVIAGQFIENYGNSITDKTALVCISQSGETKDVMNVVNHANKKGKGHILSIVNVLGSTLMNKSEVYLPLASDLEISVPATKTYLNQVSMLLYLAYRSGGKSSTENGHNMNILKKDIFALPEKIMETIEDTEEQCKKIGKELSKIKDIYSLGYGICHGTAMEGALKIKEISYAHCEGMYSSEFKHGPLSIICQQYPVIYSTVPEDADMIISHMNEVSCRNGKVIVISQEHEDIRNNAQDFIRIPGKNNPYINSILNVLPLQLIAYFWSIEVGNDPDFPRNLSKTLTVD